jgi:hypothetical protein
LPRALAACALAVAPAVWSHDGAQSTIERDPF